MGDEMRERLVEAWGRVWPRLKAEPGELERRLKRGELSLLKNPPRAWCLAVRATDRRLWPHCTKRADGKHANDVVLDSKALLEVCAPVHLKAPGYYLAEAAEMLGVDKENLVTLRLKGVLQVHHVPNPRGNPRPLVYSRQALDPSTRGFLPQDGAWTYTAEEILHRLPPDIWQVVTRVPVFRNSRPWRDIEGLHPEHPHVDPPARYKKDRRLAPPKPDYVWYKWKGDQYMGYDWRNPVAEADFKKRQVALEKKRESDKRRRQKIPYQYEESVRSWGYRWICPGCEKKVSLLYLPVAGVNLLRGYLEELEDEARVPWIRSYREGFACAKCHGIKWVSRGCPDAWNHFVSVLSGGLLYGKEVERPGWFGKKAERKNAFTARVRREPSKVRPVIEGMLLDGLSCQEMAERMGKKLGAVKNHVRLIFKQHGVHSLGEFLRKHGKKEKERPTKEIQRRVLNRETTDAIVEAMGVKREIVLWHRSELRKKGFAIADGRGKSHLSEKWWRARHPNSRKRREIVGAATGSC